MDSQELHSHACTLLQTQIHTCNFKDNKDQSLVLLKSIPFLNIFSSFCSFVSETRSHYIALAGLELIKQAGLCATMTSLLFGMISN